jgi:glycerol kinase
MDTIIAVDQSTSATKALLFDTSGQLLTSARREHEQIYPRPGWVEHDAEEIYTNTLQVLREALAQAGPDARPPLCLSLTNQRETVVVFDRRSGRPLHNAIVWQCRRGAPLCAELEAAGHGERVQQRTGLKIDTYFSASKLRWLVDARPDIRQQLASGQALCGTIDAYLIYRLTGGQVFATDPTNASRTLLYDIGRLDWDEELCALFRVPRQALPEVRASSDTFGATDLAGLLTAPLPICGVLGDSQASLFAQRCFSPGAAKVTFGSGSSLLLNLGESLRLSQRGIVTSLAWVLGGRPSYAFEGLINFSAATIAWLQNQLQLISDPAESEALALAVPDNGGVYLVPAFVGLSAPYWAPQARAAITGLTSHSSREHVARAALEAIAYQVKDLLALMAAEASLPLQYIHADGGAVRNRFLMQFVADMIGVPLHAAQVGELSALGAVFAAMLGLGVAGSLEQLAALPLPVAVYQPSMPAERVAELYAGWHRAVRQVLSEG